MSFIAKEEKIFPTSELQYTRYFNYLTLLDRLFIASSVFTIVDNIRPYKASSQDVNFRIRILHSKIILDDTVCFGNVPANY